MASGGTSPNQLSSPGQFALSQLNASLQGKAMDTFTYNVEILPAAAGQSTMGTVTINNDADFVWISTTGIATETDNTTFIDQVPGTVLFVDNGAGRALSGSPVAWDNAIGTGENPVYLDYPKFLARATSLSVTFNDFRNTNAINIRIALRGFKVFTYGA
jgi:hypothetical protein